MPILREEKFGLDVSLTRGQKSLFLWEIRPRSLELMLSLTIPQVFSLTSFL